MSYKCHINVIESKINSDETVMKWLESEESEALKERGYFNRK